MSEPIELGKEYTTRDGRAVRLYAVDGGGEYPVHGAVHSPSEDAWLSQCWTAEGVYDRNCKDNNRAALIPKPRKHTLDVWVNVSKYGSNPPYVAGHYDTRWLADKNANIDRIACKHLTVEVTEGEGLGEGAK